MSGQKAPFITQYLYHLRFGLVTASGIINQNNWSLLFSKGVEMIMQKTFYKDMWHIEIMFIKWNLDHSHACLIEARGAWKFLFLYICVTCGQPYAYLLVLPTPNPEIFWKISFTWVHGGNHFHSFVIVYCYAVVIRRCRCA